MVRTHGVWRLTWISVGILSWILIDWSHRAMGQEQPLAALPITEPPRAFAPSSSASQELVNRLRKMEERLEHVTQQNEQLAREVQELRHLNQNPSGAIDEFPAVPRSGAGRGISTAGSGGSSDSSPTTLGGGSRPGGGDPTTTGRAQIVGNRQIGAIPLMGGYYDYDNDGLRWTTQDEEFTFGVRAMQQLDARIYPNRNQEFVSSGIFNPRTRIYFEGNFTRPFTYEFSFQESTGTLNLLDSYVNYRFSDGFQLRLGRYKTPYTYEWYRIHIWDMLTPERSLFATNFEGQRRFGFMGWGSLFENRLEYAVGSFNGQRNGYVEFNSSQDVLAFLNFKPFNNREDFFLRDLQVGGSVDAGIENNPLSPAVLTTSSPPSPNTLAPGSPSVPFLAFNPNVMERGFRELWELHLAYYYQGLSLLGAWDSGFQDYAVGTSGPKPVRVPTAGYFVQAGYIVTGETIRDRTLIDPLRPFDLRNGHFGLGALELTARYSALNLGREVFSGGIADPNRWTNNAQLVDVGFNWYLNKFLKIQFDWEHAIFGNPVFYNVGRFQRSNDLFWMRLQAYF